MGLSGFPVIIESQAIMVSTRVAIGKLIHALEVWSDDPRLPNIEPLQHECRSLPHVSAVRRIDRTFHSSHSGQAGRAARSQVARHQKRLSYKLFPCARMQHAVMHAESSAC